MAKKKNLERAIVLGLLLSTSFCGSAWADVILIEGENAYPEGLRIQGVTETYSGEGKNITINAHNDSILLGASLGIWSLGTSVADGNGTINVGSLNIDVRNYIGDDGLVQDEISAGILAGPERVDSSWQENDSHNAIVTLNSDNDVNISALTRNGKSSYGIYSKTKGDVNVSSNNGSITINASKGLSSYKYDVVIHEAYIRDADYANSQAYGLNAENGKITLSADNNVSISAFIKDDSDLSWYDDYENYNNALQESDIYAVSNTNGTIDLSTGNENETGGIISLSATANKGNAYGLYTKNGVKNSINNAAKFIITAKSTDGKAYGIYADNDKNNEYNNLTNYIHAESDSGEAYGIYAINGSQIDIIATGTDENGYGNTITSNKIGVDISSGTQLNITGETYIAGDDSAMLINAATTKADITGNLTSYSKNGNAAKLTNGALLDVSKNANFISDGTPNNDGSSNALVIEGNGTFNGKNYQAVVGENLTAISKDNTAISLSNGASLHVGGNEIIYGENGLVINSSQHNVTGDLIGRADNIAVNVMGKNSNLTVGGNILVEGGNIGVTVENNTITVNGGNGTGANVIKSNSGNALKAVESIVTLNAGANGANSIVAGEIFGAEGVYYTGTAINATSASNGAKNNRTGGSKIDVLGSENFIGGTVRANGEDTVVNIGGSLANGNLTSAGSNYITSAAHGVGTGSNASVVATVFAQNDANVNIKGERNYIIAKAESIDSGNKYDERAVWAQGGSQVNIEGETIISASKAEVVFDENGIPENITLDDLKNNNLGIAIAAGTGEITDIIDPGDLVDSIPEGIGKSTINLNYTGSSVILGDIVSGWNGLVNIGDGVETSSNGNKLNFYGSAMAANGGQINLDLGGGGVWYGRADDYQDAGGDSHNSYFNPAFSNKIIDNGTVNLKMGTGSKWFVQGQSWISNITIDENTENTLIDLVSANTDHNSTAHALTIGELNGDTTFHMSLDGDRTTSDMLYIKEANGDYIVTLEEAVQTADMYTDGANRFNGLRFATIGAGSNADFRVFSSDTGFYDVEYQVEREEYDVNSDENNHYNSSNGNGNGDMEKPGDDSLGDFFGDSESGAETQNAKIALLDEVSTNDEKNQSNISADNIKITGRIGEQMSDAAQTMLNMSRANYSNAIYMDRLNKRMGEARYLNDEENEGMWVRLRHDRIGKEDAYRSQNTMYEIGYDVKQECDNGERRIGMAIDYMHGDTGYSDISGKGEIDRYGLWMYDTWMGDKGHYADYVAKWGHLSNDFEIYNSREKVTGDYSNNVFSISAEYGKKNDMGNDWYFEPQVQAQLARVTGADYTTSQGTKVSVDGINSLIGRAGFRIGKDFGAEKQSTVYLKADVLHEFLGDQTIRALDDSTDGRWADVSYENKGTWYDVGFGFATQISKASYAFMDFEKSFGNDNDETYQINVGMQWSF